MPSALIVKLNPVAAEYLRNLDELEAARRMFLDERARILDALGAVMLEAAGQHNQSVQSNRRDDAYGAYDVHVIAKYVAVRLKGGNKRTSGYSTALGSYLGHIGAQTLLWFQLKLTPLRQKTLELAALEKELGSSTKIISESGWLYIRSAAQPPKELALEALTESAQRLPELFAVADAWIAARWQDEHEK